MNQIIPNLFSSDLFQTCVMEIGDQSFIWFKLLLVKGHDFYGCGHAREALNLWIN